MEYYGDYFWYLLEDDIVTIGITDSAFDETGDIFQIVLADEGEQLTEDDGCGELRGEDGKLSILCPMDGKVVERNELLLESPESIHDDPQGESWLLRFEV